MCCCSREPTFSSNHPQVHGSQQPLTPALHVQLPWLPALTYTSPHGHIIKNKIEVFDYRKFQGLKTSPMGVRVGGRRWPWASHRGGRPRRGPPLGQLWIILREGQEWARPAQVAHSHHHRQETSGKEAEDTRESCAAALGETQEEAGRPSGRGRRDRMSPTPSYPRPQRVQTQT